MVAWLRRGILGGLHSVERTTLLAIRDAGGVESSAHDLVPDAREMLDAAAAHRHDRVLLKVVAVARDVARHLQPGGGPHAGDLAKRRVRLLGGDGGDAGADTASLGGGHALLPPLAGLQAGSRHLLLLVGSPLADELIRVRHGAGW